MLTGPEIKRLIGTGELCVTPFNESQCNPASYDLTLGHEIREFGLHPDTVLDLRYNVPGWGYAMPLDSYGFELLPGRGYLAHTVETVGDPTASYVGVVNGKSSLGRIFLSVHSTAGFVDSGFNGQITLELSCLYATRIYPGMRIAQIAWYKTVGDKLSYADTGRYQGQLGATPSRGV